MSRFSSSGMRSSASSTKRRSAGGWVTRHPAASTTPKLGTSAKTAVAAAKPTEATVSRVFWPNLARIRDNASAPTNAPHPSQHVPRHPQRQLVLAHEHCADVVLLQQARFFFAVRAYHGLYAGIECACRFHHSADVERVGYGDDQHGGPGDVGLNQYRRIGRIAGNGSDVALTQLLDDFAVLFGDHIVDAMLGERLCDAAAYATVADQHHLPGQTALLDGGRQLGQRVFAALETARYVGAREQPGAYRFDRGEEQ